MEFSITSAQIGSTPNVESIHAPASQVKVFLPKYGRNHGFVNRPNVFESLDSAVNAGTNDANTCKIVALCGLGGMGKSEIVREYCCLHQNDYRYVFWMEADTETTLQSSFLNAAQALNLPFLTTSGKYDNTVPRMIQWFQFNDGWLMVFDNADDYSLGNKDEPLRLQNVYFPKTGQGVILMTTRNDFTVQDGLPIRLDQFKMNDMEALELLLRGKTTVTNPDPFALDIIRELGYLPLAIDLVGACIKVEGITPAEYLERLRKYPADYLDLGDIQKKTGSAYGKTVLTVWNLSFNRIKSSSQLATSFSILSHSSIPMISR